MSIDIKISDDTLSGFSDEAQTRLRDATVEYATDLIEEANRIEAGSNSTNGPPEVTGAMVNDARVVLRRGLAPKKSWGPKILQVMATVLSLAVGVMYDAVQLREGGYLLLFIFVVAAAILTVTLSILRE